MKYTGKTMLWSCNDWIIKENLIVNIFGNIKLRALNFGYLMAVNMTIMSINFSKELMGFIKSDGQTCLILLQLSWNLFYGLRVVRSTFLSNFKKIWESWIFSEIYALYYIVYFYGFEMYGLYRTKLYGSVMVTLYNENDVFIEIMGKS